MILAFRQRDLSERNLFHEIQKMQQDIQASDYYEIFHRQSVIIISELAICELAMLNIGMYMAK